MEGVGWLVFFIALYFLPTLVALSRGHHQTLAISMLNLFLGWTVIGWVGALVWACTLVQKQSVSGTG